MQVHFPRFHAERLRDDRDHALFELIGHDTAPPLITIDAAWLNAPTEFARMVWRGFLVAAMASAIGAEAARAWPRSELHSNRSGARVNNASAAASSTWRWRAVKTAASQTTSISPAAAFDSSIERRAAAARSPCAEA